MNFWLCRERAALHIWRWSPCQVRPWPWMLLKPVLPPEIKEIQQVYCHSGESIRGSCSSSSSRVWDHVHVRDIRGTCSLEIYWVFMHMHSCIHTYIHWKFIRCKSCFEIHQIHSKLTFIRVQEIFERFARALSLWIFLATSELLA